MRKHKKQNGYNREKQRKFQRIKEHKTINLFLLTLQGFLHIPQAL
jgi:hypothetical protein